MEQFLSHDLSPTTPLPTQLSSDPFLPLLKECDANSYGTPVKTHYQPHVFNWATFPNEYLGSSSNEENPLGTEYRKTSRMQGGWTPAELEMFLRQNPNGVQELLCELQTEMISSSKGSTSSACTEKSQKNNIHLLSNGTRKQFLKTKLCPFQMKGKCLNEGFCSYAHTLEQLRPLPDLRQTKLCEETKKGVQCVNPDCTYAHAVYELKPTPDLLTYKTTLCFFWKKGKCFNGNKCRFAHGVHELRHKIPSAGGPQSARTESTASNEFVERSRNAATKLPAFPSMVATDVSGMNQGIPKTHNRYCNNSRSTSTSPTLTNTESEQLLHETSELFIMLQQFLGNQRNPLVEAFSPLVGQSHGSIPTTQAHMNHLHPRSKIQEESNYVKKKNIQRTWPPFPSTSASTSCSESCGSSPWSPFGIVHQPNWMEAQQTGDGRSFLSQNNIQLPSMVTRNRDSYLPYDLNV